MYVSESKHLPFHIYESDSGRYSFVCPVVYFIPRVVLSLSAFCFPISFTLCVGTIELGILLLFLLVISI
jgi:hypothetical protein